MSLILPLLVVLVAMSLVMALGWWVQRATDNGGWVDVFWTYGTGICGAAVVLTCGAATPRRFLIAGLLALWSLRLGTYIAHRVVGGGHEDPRYARLKQEWGQAYQARMFGFMQIQAPATVLLCLAALVAAQAPQSGLGVADLIGGVILVGSILGEGLADQQMGAFRAEPANRGKVCDTGLWGWSRHPNYFFEFLLWVAYPVIAFGAGAALWPLALLAPLAMYALLRFGTGVPPLEEAMRASRGEAFRAYQARVPVFIPFPPPGRKARQTA